MVAKIKQKIFLLAFYILTTSFSLSSFGQSNPNESFSFSVAADMRDNAGPDNDNVFNFRGAIEALKRVGAGKFMLSPGDIDPPQNIRWSIDKYLGKEFPWYPILGNHEVETESDMDYLRELNKGGDKLPYIVNKGPEGTEETMYSFDFNNSHFVIVNQYYDGNCDVCADGDMNDPIYNWLKADLDETEQKYIFVFGHEPAFVQPDEFTARLRHNGDSLGKYRKNRDRFWKLLEDKNVIAYFCGHTHNYSAVLINNVWQIDAGHARGDDDTGAPSTFLRLDVSDEEVVVNVYRETHNENYDYTDIVKSFRVR